MVSNNHVCMHELIMIILLCCSNVLVTFHEACSLGLADVVEAFLECNGDDLITMGDGNGLNALQIATTNKRNLVVQILLRRYDYNTIVPCMHMS
jgi:ankyrin repeat protein